MKISVITAVRNNRDTIAAALDSILAQTHPDVELVVIDGASTDGTLEILQRYAPRLQVFISEPDHGIYDALNKGLARASGDVVGFLHADDLLEDAGVLAGIAQALADPNVDGIYGDLVYVRKNSPEQVLRYWRSGRFSRTALRYGWMPPHPTLYLRRAVYERSGYFNERYRIAADYDFILRLFASGTWRVDYLPRVLVRMRAGGASNGSLKSVWRKSCEDLHILRTNGVGGWGSLLCKNISKLPQLFSRTGN